MIERELTMINKQKGLALIVAMIVLVVMSIAGIGLIRSVDTGVLVAGNLAFRQSATQAADIAVEEARTWLLANASGLTADIPARGYYATSLDTLDMTGNKTQAKDKNNNNIVYSAQVKWLNPSNTLNTGMAEVKAYCPTTTALTSTTGNKYCYIIQRLCNAAGPLSGGTCSTKSGIRGGSTLGASRQMASYQQGSWISTTAYGYYRITVRVAGPRNNFSFVQAYILIGS